MGHYDEDFVLWTEITARAIREERWQDIDRAALIDEVESLGKRDRREVVSRLIVLLQHMLKAENQEFKQTRSWTQTLEEQRNQLTLILDDRPSIRAQGNALLAKAYRDARREAAMETGLDLCSFPDACPWPFEQVING